MTAVNKLLSIARAELGYKEKSSNSNLDNKTANAGSGNWTKYSRDLDAVVGFYNGRKNGYAWCDIFTDWCFVQAFGVTMAKKLLCQPDNSAGAGCTYSLAYYMQKGQFYRDPQPGDQIFFGTVGASTHTGIVESVSNGRVNTIEGNTSDGVFQRSYALGASNIAGYGRPDWSLVGEVTNDIPSDVPQTDPYVTPSTPSVSRDDGILRDGSVGEDVRKLQSNLIKLGYSVGSCGADGEFGADTKAAVLKFQREHGLEVDGEVGPLTLAAIDKALKTPDPVADVKPTSPAKTSFSVGDTVMFTGSVHYASSTEDISYPATPGKAKITVIYKGKNGKHPYHLVKVAGGGSNVFGWVDEKDIQAV